MQKPETQYVLAYFEPVGRAVPAEVTKKITNPFSGEVTLIVKTILDRHHRFFLVKPKDVRPFTPPAPQKQEPIEA